MGDSIAAFFNSKSQGMYDSLLLRLRDFHGERKHGDIHVYEPRLTEISRRMDAADHRMRSLIELLVGLEEPVDHAIRVGGGYMYDEGTSSPLFDRETQDEMLSIIGVERRLSTSMSGTLRPGQRLGISE